MTNRDREVIYAIDGSAGRTAAGDDEWDTSTCCHFVQLGFQVFRDDLSEVALGYFCTERCPVLRRFEDADHCSCMAMQWLVRSLHARECFMV